MKWQSLFSALPQWISCLHLELGSVADAFCIFSSTENWCYVSQWLWAAPSCKQGADGGVKCNFSESEVNFVQNLNKFSKERTYLWTKKDCWMLWPLPLWSQSRGNGSGNSEHQSTEPSLHRHQLCSLQENSLYLQRIHLFMLGEEQKRKIGS